jgi:predicted DNA-binding ribbon-helix-helix protein
MEFEIALCWASQKSVSLRGAIVAASIQQEYFPLEGHDLMNSSIIKRSVVLGRHKTSVSLEDEFWSTFREIADAQGVAVSTLIEDIDKTRGQNNLSSSIRLFVLNYFRSHRGSGA